MTWRKEKPTNWPCDRDCLRVALVASIKCLSNGRTVYAAIGEGRFLIWKTEESESLDWFHWNGAPQQSKWMNYDVLNHAVALLLRGSLIRSGQGWTQINFNAQALHHRQQLLYERWSRFNIPHNVNNPAYWHSLTNIDFTPQVSSNNPRPLEAVDRSAKKFSWYPNTNSLHISLKRLLPVRTKHFGKQIKQLHLRESRHCLGWLLGAAIGTDHESNVINTPTKTEQENRFATMTMTTTVRRRRSARCWLAANVIDFYRCCCSTLTHTYTHMWIV